MSAIKKRERRITISGGLPLSLYEKLQRIAEREDRSLRKLVSYAVIEHYELEGEDASNMPSSPSR